MGSNKKTLCRNLFVLKNCGLTHCPKAHDEKELRIQTIPARADYKKKDCYATSHGQFCHLGAACLDIHGDEMTLGVCKMYAKTGRCYFPTDCPLETHTLAKPAAPYAPNHAIFYRRINNIPY